MSNLQREERSGVTPRPVALPVRTDRIPDPMRAERRWVVWRYEWEVKDSGVGRWTKIPHQPAGRRAKPNDSSTWFTFAEVVSAYEQEPRRWDGIGFPLGDGWCGIDLDDCRTPSTGALLPAARSVIKAAEPAHTEISPSGAGIRIVGRAPQLGFEIRYSCNEELVVWQSSRFVAITGHGWGNPLTDISTLIRDRVGTRPAPPPTDRIGYQDAAFTTDDDLLLQAVGATNGRRFLSLWRGDISDYASQSEADLALCGLLAFWTNYDRERVDRLFRQSDLYRDKWDSWSYRSATLNRALGGVPREPEIVAEIRKVTL
jgi:putative DNA primase/helicase